jgi:hypothetical protein
MNLLIVCTVSAERIRYGSLSGDRLSFSIGKRALSHGHSVDVLFNREPTLDIRTLTKGGELRKRFSFVSYDIVLLTIYEIGDLTKIEHFVLSGAKVGLVVPAIWWLEHPDLFHMSLLQRLIHFVTTKCDFAVCSGKLNQDYLARFFRLMARADLAVFTEDYYIDIGQSVASKSDEKRVIMDLGGAWRWTDLDTFTRAYKEYTSTGNRRLYLVLPGFKPNDNFDHGEYVANLKKLCQEVNPENIRILDWDDRAGYHYWAKRAHYGLHINKDSFEAEMAHRVRFFDYLSHRIPIITTPQGRLPKIFSGVALTVDPSEKSYFEALEKIENSPFLYDELKQAYSGLDMSAFNRPTFITQYAERFVPKVVHRSEETFPTSVHRSDDQFSVLDGFKSKFDLLPSELRANLFNFTLSDRGLWPTFKLVPEFNALLVEYLIYYLDQPEAHNERVSALIKNDGHIMRYLSSIKGVKSSRLRSAAKALLSAEKWH